MTPAAPSVRAAAATTVPRQAVTEPAVLSAVPAPDFSSIWAAVTDITAPQRLPAVRSTTATVILTVTTPTLTTATTQRATLTSTSATRVTVRTMTPIQGGGSLKNIWRRRTKIHSVVKVCLWRDRSGSPSGRSRYPFVRPGSSVARQQGGMILKPWTGKVMVTLMVAGALTNRAVASWPPGPACSTPGPSTSCATTHSSIRGVASNTTDSVWCQSY